ncbi:MAG: hypothetical protein WCR58_04490 [Bacteroidales bacterium]|jgi:hypothetical protein|nr:hypothetical protein [Bacteroidales bacterium]MDX9795635.1 hypothetical protein [Arcobacteraceae bacterium]
MGNGKIEIIGGSKVAYNLYFLLISKGQDAVYYFFNKDYGSRKKGGLSFNNNFSGLTKISSEIIIASETAFNALELDIDTQPIFKTHAFLRNKNNIQAIATEMKVEAIQEYSKFNEIEQFPVVVKQKGLNTGLPFKFRIVKSKSDIEQLKFFENNCIIQPFLGTREFDQISIAGYFSGIPESLMAVYQLNQYPVGISSFIKLSNAHDWLKKLVSNYLNSLSFRDFIEIEFKVKRSSDEAYLMDINPRLWGWSYYYLASITNLVEVLHGAHPLLNPKKNWVNTPRLIFSYLNGRFITPSFKDVFSGQICYEKLIF